MGFILYCFYNLFLEKYSAFIGRFKLRTYDNQEKKVLFNFMVFF